jgi:hypothetical protein
MNARFLLIIAVAIGVSGCAHTHRVNLSSEPSAFDEINARLKDKDVEITSVDGRTFTGKSPQLAPDSTSWYDPETYHQSTVATSEIRRIVTLKRLRGALEGLKYGALIGAAAGLGYGVASGADEDAHGYGPDIDTPSWGVMLAADGALVGLVVGTIVGSKDEYVIECDCPRSQPSLGQEP